MWWCAPFGYFRSSINLDPLVLETKVSGLFQKFPRLSNFGPHGCSIQSAYMTSLTFKLYHIHETISISSFILRACQKHFNICPLIFFGKACVQKKNSMPPDFFFGKACVQKKKTLSTIMLRVISTPLAILFLRAILALSAICLQALCHKYCH